MKETNINQYLYKALYKKINFCEKKFYFTKNKGKKSIISRKNEYKVEIWNNKIDIFVIYSNQYEYIICIINFREK